MTDREREIRRVARKAKQSKDLPTSITTTVRSDEWTLVQGHPVVPT